MIRGSRTRINNMRRRGYPRFNSVNGWIVYESDSEQEVGALDSGEDLRMRSRSWEDDSRSWRLSWQRQRNLVISTNTPDSGNPEGAI